MTLADLKAHSLIRIVDDDADVRDALSFMLECEEWRTVTYPDAKSFLVADRPSEPGCLLLDIRMPGLTGIELQRLMAEQKIAIPIIFITGHADVDTAVDALRRGAVDFLQKPVDEARLLESIREACELSASSDEGRWSAEQVTAALDAMSPRERQITELLRAGLSNAEIAERLGLSRRSVQGHRYNIYKRLCVHNSLDFNARLAVVKNAQA